MDNAVREFEEFKDITGIDGLIRLFALPSMFALCTAQEVPKLKLSICIMTCAVSSLYCTFSYWLSDTILQPMTLICVLVVFADYMMLYSFPDRKTLITIVNS